MLKGKVFKVLKVEKRENNKMKFKGDWEAQEETSNLLSGALQFLGYKDEIYFDFYVETDVVEFKGFKTRKEIFRHIYTKVKNDTKGIKFINCMKNSHE